jgi:hypothetical protein
VKPACLLTTIFLLGGCATETEGTARTRAAAYLWSRQAPDGGWHSDVYTLLRSGQALTPFVLHALLAVPEEECPRPENGVAKALSFLRRHARAADGALGLSDPDLLEYPNYATAYALLCLVQCGDPGDRNLVARMRSYLVRQQYREENGYPPEAPAHGGWGFGGERPRGQPGHMDLAHTRRVLEALRAAGCDDAGVYERALLFLARTQRQAGSAQHAPDAPTFDGGFYFSPVVLDANKGAGLGSYATATCDGLLALLAAGVPEDDARVHAARAWLLRHDDLAHPAGIRTDAPLAWGPHLAYYHLAVRAEAKAAPPGRIAEMLHPRQRADGSFKNPHHLMKEDDPLVCTALALIALG